MPAETETEARSAEPEIVLQHYRKICEEHDKVDDSKAAEASLVAAAAASGVDVRALKHARKVAKMGPRDGKTYLDNVVYYTNLITGGMMGQDEMFGRNEEPVEDSILSVQKQWVRNREATASGYSIGKAGGPNANPYTAGSEEAPFWAKAWGDGHEDYIAANGTEIHPRKGSRRPEDPGEDDGEDAS